MNDILMRPITVGQHVAYRYKGTMEVGVVTKIGKKQLSIERLSTGTSTTTSIDHVYPGHSAILPDDAVVMWLLQGKKNPRRWPESG